MKQTNEYSNKERLTDIESKRVITSGERGVGDKVVLHSTGNITNIS